MVSDGSAPVPVWLNRLRTYLPRLYLTRFPLLLGAALVLIVPLALFWVPTMFRSMFILGPRGISVVCLFATAAAATVMATRRVALLHGKQRFGAAWVDVKPDVTVRAVIRHFLLAAPIVGTVVWLSSAEGDVGLITAVASALAGVAAAALLLMLALLIQAGLTRPETGLEPVLFSTGSRLVEAVHRRNLVPDRLDTLMRGMLDRMRPLLGPGYFGSTGDLLAGHTFAAGLLLAFCAVYAAGYWLGQPGSSWGARVPALAYLLIVLSMWTWLLAGTAFFLDRHRVPTLLPVIAWSSLVAAVSNSDHYFQLQDAPAQELALLAEPGVIAAERKHPLLTVVAVDGGGIQAAAWAATVLTHIQGAWPDFRHSVRFISAVSGGSVGTMFFVAALGPERPEPGELEDVRALAAQGSLNEAAWGLAYPDLWRMLAPIPPRLRFEKDRGWAMEQAWKRRLLEPAPRMSDWMRGVREGWRPAVAMNATGVESGQRATFGTFRAPDAWGLHTLASRYPGKDIEVSTAARLSATFPYVTPIARAWPESAETSAVHFADGGYYDNTGMGIAMLWLDRALSQDPARYAGRQVAFIRIRSGPAVSATAVKDRAWLYESIGPFQTLLAVRTAGQRERADTELQFLQRLWCARGTDIKSIEFSFERADPPLSWQLSPAQASAIDVEWRADRNQAALDDLRKTAASPVTTGCVAAR